MTAIDALEQGRQAFTEQAWRDAYEQLCAADVATPLEPADLERLAMASYLLGRDEDSLGFWERAHPVLLERGEIARAVRCAFWLVFVLLHRGEMARGGGWLARADRLLDTVDLDCAERGYLLFPAALQQIMTGDTANAYDRFGRAVAIGERFGDPDLVALARHGQGRSLIRLGETAHGSHDRGGRRRTSRLPAMVTSNPALQQLGGYPLARLQDLANELRAQDVPLADFAIGDPDEPTPEHIRRALVEALGPVSRYPTAAGQPALREAVAGWLERRHGVEVDPDVHVLPSAGSKEAIFHLPLAVLDPNGPRPNVLWGEPGYPVYGRGALFAGGTSDPVALGPERDWRLELGELGPQRLERACIAWVNYPHNPTGATADLDYYRRALRTAREHDVLLASDECYQEIWFDEPAPSILEAAEGDFTGLLAFVSLSKRSGMTGYRSGAIVGDPELVARLRTLRPNVGTASPDFVQAAAVAAWDDQAHVDERREVFAAKRAVLLEFLATAGIEVSGSDATFYVWFRAPGGDDAAYAEALLDERIVATPGRAFGPAGEGWLRLALVPTVDGCHAAVARWSGALQAGRLPT